MNIMLNNLGKKIIIFELISFLYIKIVTYYVPFFKVTELIFDFVNVFLILFLIFSNHPSKLFFRLFVPIFFLLIFCVVRYFYSDSSLTLFLWGIRNVFRFLLFFYSSIIFLTQVELVNIFHKMYVCLLINVPLITFQFINGVGRDYLGGTFGVEKNSNAVVNVFLISLVTYFLILFITKKIDIKKLIVVVGCSFYWAVLAELKIFFIELFFSLFICVFFIRGNLLSKLKILILGFLLFTISVALLYFAYPEQVVFVVNPSSIIWYLNNVHGGAYGFGRTTAFQIINSVFFNSELYKLLFGVGVGAAEYIDVFNYNLFSDFYKQYNEYAYNGYFYSMIYIQMGLLGLFWYCYIWMCTFVASLKLRAINRRFFYFSIIFSFLMLLLAFKDSTLLISISGYLSFFLFSIPYICLKTKSKEYC